MYRELHAPKIIATASNLQRRIANRFPGSSLSKVGIELTDVAQEASERCRVIRKGRPFLRGLITLVCLFGLLALGVMFSHVRLSDGMWHIENFLEELDAALGSLVFLGAALFFLFNLETRLKSKRVLEALTELRNLAHVVDMHQLAKSPEIILAHDSDIEMDHNGRRSLSSDQLSHYYDYCSELLSMISKVASLYAQAFSDPLAFNAVDDIENLCTGLSRKIWQKIMLLKELDSASAESAARQT